jgi:hypothetical protein
MMFALQAGLIVLAAALGVLAARRSMKLAVGLGATGLALIAAKYALGWIPAAEARALPWGWYAHVAAWWYEIPAFFLAGAGLRAARASWWKRDLILVLIGLFAVRIGWNAWETRGGHERLTGTVTADGACVQSSVYSCAPAAAASLLWHHGIAADEREMAELCLTRPGLGGTSECGLMRGLRKKVGDRVRIGAPRYESLPAPCIVSIEKNWLVAHTLVVREVTPDHVVVMDPAAGIGRVKRAAFEREWMGSAIWIER